MGRHRAGVLGGNGWQGSARGRLLTFLQLQNLLLFLQKCFGFFPHTQLLLVY